ncbi:hypothetical protein B0H66DRAFT_531755 [Apodospora peruviana]|uniref:25S rRNA (uridine-N(3))-methyltransferase BMT5-like domain-containing protein n=1 Tax=Apodospora peruviana TaxID=516989 RepID=A0AAE0M913_9PEZI|nr:hypothetical protein B0H66DRAFT_531755 [Apodospora peruviana]
MAKKRGGGLQQALKAAKQSQQQQGGPAAKRQKTTHHQPNNSNATAAHKPKPKPATPQPRQHVEPTIPFSPKDAILLIGEGDLSFAASLASPTTPFDKSDTDDSDDNDDDKEDNQPDKDKNNNKTGRVYGHGCTNLTATVLESSPEELLAKYPHAQQNIDKILSSKKNKILYGIDARKFAPFVKKSSKPREPPTVGAMDRIIFNFPHVGGKSTDVNRQVRYNQELLVDFFKRVVHSLAPGGSIIVTLFEGEPYTLWNIRDLARHSGLHVERSFRFQAEAYPGYRHARTLGVVKTKDGGVSGTGWKGEERAARSYVFMRKEEVSNLVTNVKRKKKKRKAGEESSSEEEEVVDHDNGYN